MDTIVFTTSQLIIEAFEAADMAVVKDPATGNLYPKEYSIIFHSRLLSGGMIPTEFEKVIPKQFMEFYKEQFKASKNVALADPKLEREEKGFADIINANNENLELALKYCEDK